MEILLALAAAVSYGVSDFAGGVLTRRAHVFVVLLLSQLVSPTSRRSPPSAVAGNVRPVR